jgi:hypothetical protein
MKIEDTILLTTEHYGPAGSEMDRITLSDKPVEELIANLGKNGIDIIACESEQTVSYQFRENQRRGVSAKTATVPLGTTLPVQTIPARFYLRNKEGLELVFRNYDNITQRPPEGVFGGSYGGHFGIACEVILERTDLDITIPKRVKSAMEQTYSPGMAEIRQFAKNQKPFKGRLGLVKDK